MMHVIEPDTEAYRYLAEAFATDEHRKISIDIRTHGIAVKVGEGMWTHTMAATTPHVGAWANAFGVWQAEVVIVGTGDDERALRLAVERIAQELTDRSPRNTVPTFGLKLIDRVSRDGAIAYSYTECDASTVAVYP